MSGSFDHYHHTEIMTMNTRHDGRDGYRSSHNNYEDGKNAREESLSSTFVLDAFPLYPFQEVNKEDFYKSKRQQNFAPALALNCVQDPHRRRIENSHHKASQHNIITNHHGEQVVLDETHQGPPRVYLQHHHQSVGTHHALTNKMRAPSHISSGRQLSPNFSPGPWSVIVGRDKVALDAHGNKRLRVIVGLYLERYAKSHKDKDEKSLILSEIESTIRSACGGARGAFIKYNDGKWWEVENGTVREKIGRLLREALHTRYSSSSRRKRERRRSKGNKLLANKDESDVDSSSGNNGSVGSTGGHRAATT
jgi:hypothetical protein